MMGHISLVGVIDYIGMAAFLLMALAATITVWMEDRRDDPDAELIDLVERLRRDERQR